MMRLKKHGRRNFKKETLLLCENIDEAFEMEANIVDKNFILHNDVYNLKTGGTNAFANKTHSEEQKAKWRKMRKGVRFTEEAKRKK